MKKYDYSPFKHLVDTRLRQREETPDKSIEGSLREIKIPWLRHLVVITCPKLHS